MATVHPALGRPHTRPGPVTPARGDLGLLALLLGIHTVPLIGFALHSAGWGQGTAAYGAAIVFLVARELLREIAGRSADRA